MGKDQPQGQQNKNQQDEAPLQRVEELKKKIIKKIPIKSTSTKQDDLKHWKPTKIEKKVIEPKQNNMKQQNIAESFLKSLSKPVNKATSKQPIFFDDDEPIKLAPKPILNLNKLTPEQIKWDIEDQTFIQKQFIPNRKIQHNLEQGEEDPLEEVALSINPRKTTQVKVKQIDISKVINENWRQAAQRKQTKNELWEGAQGLLDGRGNLAKLARQAQERATQIQSQLNKRSYQKKQMKSRYGW